MIECNYKAVLKTNHNNNFKMERNRNIINLFKKKELTEKKCKNKTIVAPLKKILKSHF